MGEKSQTAGPTRPLITQDGRRKIIIIASVSGALAFLSFFTPVNSQQRHMRAAQHHIDLIAPGIHADSRFREVVLQPYTDGDGSLGVFGSVANAADLADLKRIVEESKPPVHIFFCVFNDEEMEHLKQQPK